MVLLALVAATVLPVVLRARRAYEQIFITPPPRVRVVENPQGTPALVVEPTEEAVTLPDWEKKERINILLLGVDATAERLATGDVPRADTMIIVTIDPVTRRVDMLAIPRDLLVTIPGVGRDKINASYPYGATSNVTTGPGLAIATIEHNFGIPIHYFAEVNIEGFIKIVDTLGGVIVDVPAPTKDDQYPGEGFNYTRIYFHTGLQHMDGRTALRYARTRHDDSDFGRGMRQQQVLKALREQGVQLELIAKAPELLEELGDTVRTDLRPEEVLALAKLATEIEEGDIQSYSLANAVTAQWAPNQPFYLIPDWDAVHAIVNEMVSSAPVSNPPDRRLNAR